MNEFQELLQRLDRLAEEHHGPRPPVDPVQVQREVRAYLLQRGRDLAQDMDLGQQRDDDLVRLAELDCIAQNPGVNPDLALHLEMIVAKRAATPREWSWSVQQELHRGHRHSWNASCGQDVVTTPISPGQSMGDGIGHHTPWPRPAPEPGTTTTPDIPGMGDGSPNGQGRGDHAGREQRKESESDNRRKRYWDELTKDRPGEQWS